MNRDRERREHEASRSEDDATGRVGARSRVEARYGGALGEALARRSADGESSPTIHDAATAAVEHKDGGGPVDPGVATQVGAHLGADFAGVRVHGDPLAREATAAMGARAFAYGSDVFLGPGESGQDLGLMAHELTHVVQQGAAGQRAPQRQVQVGDANSPAEAQADAVAGAVTGGAAPASLIVDDGPVAPGQMLKSTFIEQLRTQVSAAAAEELGPLGAVVGCPYIDQYFGRYAGQPAATGEALLRRYAPATRGVRTAAELFAPIVTRVREGVRQWRDTGQAPPDIAAADPSAAAAAAGAAPVAAPKLAEPDSPADLVGRLGPGESLDGATASRMEGAFGETFGAVRIHTDAAAARVAADHDAHALTVGQHVAFAAGAFQPGSVAGDALIAHELAHVGQQAGAGPAEQAVQRKVTDDSAAEVSADAAARGVIASLYGGAKSAARAIRDGLTTDVGLKRCTKSTPLPTGTLAPGGSVAHTTGATMDTYVSSSAAVQAYVAPQIAAGRIATGHVHFHNGADFRTRFIAYATSRGMSRTDAEAMEPGVEAFRENADIHVHQDRGEPATVIHEAMHLYQNDAYPNQLGQNVKEGTTEWLMNIVCAEQSVAVLRPAYVSETGAIRRMETKLGGRDAIMRAYFGGDIAGLRTAVDAVTSAGTFDRWVTEMKAGNYAAANLLMA